MKKPGFLVAALGPFRGFVFLQEHPALIRFLLIPWALLLFFLGAFAFLSFTFFPDLQGWLLGDMEGFFRSVLSIFLAIMLGLVAILLAFLFSQLLSAPIYTRLAAETRSLYTGIPARPAGGVYADVVLPILSQAQKIVLFLVPQVPLLLLNLVPVVGSIVYLALNTVFTLFWIAMDYFDYPLDTESHPLTVTNRIQYVFQHFPMTSGFSATMMLVLYIPVVNLLVLPVGVIGATLLHCDMIQAESNTETSL